MAVEVVSPEGRGPEHESPPGRHQNGVPLPFQDGGLFEVDFQSRRELCSGDDVRPAYEIVFSHDTSHVSPFSPGSALGVICPNVAGDVEAMLTCLKLNGTEYLHIGPLEPEGKVKTRFDRSFTYVPEYCSLRYLLEYVVDLRTVLKKAFLKVLGDCCPEGSSDRKRLHELSSSDQEGYRTDVLEGRMMIFDLLKTFPSCQPSLALLVEYLNRLSPRFYSVANSSPNEIRFIYRPIQFQSQGRMLTGQCSEMFAQLRKKEEFDDLERRLTDLTLKETSPMARDGSNTKVKCYLRKNVRNFSFPNDASIPFMFVCHGTGIAPFIAYSQWLRSSPTQKPDEFWLFYGCRYADRDNLIDVLDSGIRESGCQVELRQSRQDSADGDSVRRGYAQNGLVDHAEIVRKMLLGDTQGQLLICGDFQTMAKDTLTVLKQILDPDTVDTLLKANRIKLDVWT